MHRSPLGLTEPEVRDLRSRVPAEGVSGAIGHYGVPLGSPVLRERCSDELWPPASGPGKRARFETPHHLWGVRNGRN